VFTGTEQMQSVAIILFHLGDLPITQHWFKSAETNMILAEGFSERGPVYSVQSE